MRMFQCFTFWHENVSITLSTAHPFPSLRSRISDELSITSQTEVMWLQLPRRWVTLDCRLYLLSTTDGFSLAMLTCDHSFSIAKAGEKTLRCCRSRFADCSNRRRASDARSIPADFVFHGRSERLRQTMTVSNR